jgi:hypothetical protein
MPLSSSLASDHRGDDVSPPIAAVLSQLKGVRRTRRGWLARCPAHDDRTASLSVGVGREGRVLLHCFGGCSFPVLASYLLDEPPSGVPARVDPWVGQPWTDEAVLLSYHIADLLRGRRQAADRLRRFATHEGDTEVAWALATVAATLDRQAQNAEAALEGMG